MKKLKLFAWFCALGLPLVLMLTAAKTTKSKKESQIARGKYLVNFGGCSDCHTPMKMGPKGPEPDMARYLSGHPENANLPTPPKLPPGPWAVVTAPLTAWSGPWGISYAPNLTPDTNTGMGIWTEEIFMKAMRTGKHFGTARPILPPMPWQTISTLNDEDLKAIFAFLRTIPAVTNHVPDAVPASEVAAK